MEKQKQKLRPIYLTDDKYEEVCKKAKKKGMDFSNYVKSRI